MKQTKYFCNLCREEKPKQELRALYWKCDVIPQKYTLSLDVDSSDKHICTDCIKIIKNGEIKMKKYKKNAIEVEALQWTGDYHRDMYDFLTNYSKIDDYIEPFNEDFRIDFSKGEGGMVIKTSEGDMFANIGDYIIKEPFDKERKFYPCKKEIFERTYTEV